MSKFDTHGGYFSPKDYLRVNEGGSHEENPNGGVQIGVDPEGNPNLLEEGEPVYKDYVYSDNIEADEKFLVDNNLPKKYAGKLYSKIADDFVSEAEERPLDPISRNGLEVMLGRLAEAQEGQKQAKEQADLEAELANLSPEELDELEMMLAQGQELVGTDNPAYGPGPVGMEGPEGIVPEQMPMMACGGRINRYDGESEKTGFLRRLLSYPVRVPNMTGTATAASTSLGSIPLSDSTVGQEALVAGTALASPFAQSIAANPFVDAYFTADGIENALSDNGISKTIRLAKEGDTWGAIKSGAGDLLDIGGAYSLLKGASKVGKVMYEGANGVALTSAKVADRIKEAERIAEEANKAKKEAEAAARKTEHLVKTAKSGSKKSAELSRYAESKIQAAERANDRVQESRQALEDLVDSQVEAIKNGSSVPGFDVKAQQYRDVIASKTHQARRAEEKAERAVEAAEKKGEQLDKIIDRYFKENSGSSLDIPLVDQSAGTRNTLRTMFDPTYWGRRASAIPGNSPTISGLKQLPIVLGSYGAAGAGIGGIGYGVYKSAAEESERQAERQSKAPDFFVLPEDAVISTDSTYVDPSWLKDDPVVVKTDTTQVRKFGGNIQRNSYPGGGLMDFINNVVIPYTPSTLPGGVSGTYAIDRVFNLGKYKTIEDLEKSEAYDAFTKYVMRNSNDPEVQAYLRALDKGTNQQNGVPLLFGSDDKLVDNWKDLFYERRYDKTPGIYHLNPEDIYALGPDEPLAQWGPESGIGVPNHRANVNDWYAARAYDTMSAVNPALAYAARTAALNGSPDDILPRSSAKGTPPSGPGNGSSGDSSPYDIDLLPTWQRYSGAIGSGLLGLYNVFQQPDKYTAQRITPYTPEGRIHLQNQVYNPIDQNMIANAQIAQGNATNRALRNSGLGPSTAASILAADNNTTGNLGTGFIQAWDANNQRRNAVIAANNQAEAQRAQFDANIDYYRKDAMNKAAMYNAQNDLMLQRLNYGAEGDKYSAISNQIANGLQALSGIGQENFAMNQINTNPAYLGYGVGVDGAMFYNPLTGRLERYYGDKKKNG